MRVGRRAGSALGSGEPVAYLLSRLNVRGVSRYGDAK